MSLLLIAAVSIIASLAPPTDKLTNSEMTEIHFCHFEVPEHLKSMNASFSIVYSITIGPGGQPAKIEKLQDKYLETKNVLNCLEKWRLPKLTTGSELAVVANWEHGVGWTQISLVGEEINQRIVRTGELSPYPSK